MSYDSPILRIEKEANDFETQNKCWPEKIIMNYMDYLCLKSEVKILQPKCAEYINGELYILNIKIEADDEIEDWIIIAPNNN